MSSEIQAQQNEQQIAIEGQKRKAWGDMGVIIYRKELELQVSAQASLSKLEVMPTCIEDVPAAEASLKEVKADCVKLTDERKKITSKFEEVTQRLMQPEKSFTAPVAEFSNAIIKVKKDYEAQEKKKQDKLNEKNRIRQQVIVAASNLDAQYKMLVSDKVNEAYAFALNNGTKPEEKDDYIDRVCFRVTEKMFQILTPVIHATLCTVDEIEKIVNEHFSILPSTYVELFKTEINKKFTDYDIAFKNKKEALRIAEEEQAKQLLEIQQEQQNATISAALDCTATELLSVEPEGFKALKKAYEIDMPETFENAMKIMSAFLANKQKAFEKTTVKKWFSFNADSAGKALAKLKSEDNAFAPAGITFKEVDKL